MWHKLRLTHPRECCLVSPLSLLRSVGPSHRAQDDGASPHPPANWQHRMGTGWMAPFSDEKKERKKKKGYSILPSNLFVIIKGEKRKDVKGHLRHNSWINPGHIPNACVCIYCIILPSLTLILYAEPGVCFGQIPLHKKTHSSDKAKWYLTVLFVVCTLTRGTLCQLSRPSCSVQSCHCSGANLDITFYVPSTP